ncbi:MAG: hypothetical protein ACE5GU_13745 [Candidatus Scalinduaceae bacterium]
MANENFSRIVAGQKTVTTAGTPENLPDVSIPTGYPVTIKALDSNTGAVYLAEKSADAATAATRFTLQAGQAITLRIINLNVCWLDSAVNGEGIEYIVEQ